MFEDLAAYERIYVTGPQRSGTTICARMICHDTGHHYIDGEPHNRNTPIQVRNMFRHRKGIVVQAPFLAHGIHQAVVGDLDSLVVYMIRDVADILASQKRIKWADAKELKRFPGATYETLAQEKYDRWYGVSRSMCPHWLEVEYESLSAHPLWVPKEKRRSMTWGKRKWRV